MIRRRRGVADPDCGHHWHADEQGWACCACPGRVTASSSPPAAGTAGCAAEPVDERESITAWLATAAPPRRHRPGRRMPRGVPPYARTGGTS